MTTPAEADRRLHRAKALIDARFGEPLTVSSVADEVGVTRSHFSRAFSRAFAVSPHQYLKDLRLARAAELLRETEKPVGQICREVGFRSVGSFTIAFRERFREPPAAYRSRHLGA